MAKKESGILARRVRSRLAELGIGQADLAQASEIDPGLVSRYLRGEHEIPAGRLAQMAAVLDLPAATLQAWADEDRLGEDRARNLARQVAVNDSRPAAITADQTAFPPAETAPIGVPAPGSPPDVVKAIEWLNALPPAERLAELRYLEERVRRLQREQDLSGQGPGDAV